MKTTTTMIALFALFTLAGSGCAFYTGQEGETLFACYDSCDVQAQGRDCSDEVAEEWPWDCYDICEAVVVSLGDDDRCLRALEDAYRCDLDMEWECGANATAPNAFMDRSCDAEYEVVAEVCDY